MSATPPDQSAAPSGPDVLLVDDDPVVGRFYAAILGRADLVVAVETEGRAALTRLRTSPPRLVVSDIHMPDMDGLALARAAAADGLVPGPLLLLSADASGETVEAGLAAGADGVLIKGQSPPALAATVTFWLQSGFPCLPQMARLRARALAASDPARPLDVDRLSPPEQAGGSPTVEALRAEIAAVGRPVGDATRDRLAILGRLVALLLDAATCPEEALGLPWHVDYVLARSDFAWARRRSALYAAFDRIAAEPAFRQALTASLDTLLADGGAGVAPQERS